MSTSSASLRPLSFVCILVLASAGCDEGDARLPLEPVDSVAPAHSVVESTTDPGTVAQADRTDSDDASIAGIAGRLRAVDRVLSALGKRMDRIEAAVPPEPVVPPEPILTDLEAALGHVETDAKYVRDLAAYLEVAACEAETPPRPTSIAAGEATIAEVDRTASGDDSLTGLVGRLGSVGNVLGAVSKRMDDIDAAVPPEPVVPPEPITPATCVQEILGPLAAIQTGAMHVLQVNRLIAARLMRD